MRSCMHIIHDRPVPNCSSVFLVQSLASASIPRARTERENEAFPEKLMGTAAGDRTEKARYRNVTHSRGTLFGWAMTWQGKEPPHLGAYRHWKVTSPQCCQNSAKRLTRLLPSAHTEELKTCSILQKNKTLKKTVKHTDKWMHTLWNIWK